MPRTKAKARQANGAGSVERTETGWRVWVTLDNGKRVSRRTKTNAEALAVLHELNAAKATGDPLPPSPADSKTLGTQLAHWRDYVLPAKRLAPATVENYRWALITIDTELGKARLAALTAEHVEEFLRDQAAKGYSRNSVRLMRGALSQVLGEAERRDHVDRNVAKLTHLPADARAPAERRSLTPEEAARFMAAIDGDPMEAYFVLALTTGARRGELLGLSWDNVDLKAGTMTIRQALHRGPKGGYVIGTTKTKSSVRTVRLGTTAVRALRRHRKTAVRHVGTEDLVFTTATGAHFDPSRLRRRWEALCEKAGLEGVVLHELRHTAGSVAVDSGVALATVADQLGHANISQLAETYRHRTRAVVEDVAGVMDDFINQSS